MKLNKKGYVKQLLPALVVPLVLIIMVSIYSGFSANVNQAGWTTEANDTYDDVNDGTWSGFTLAAQIPFVVIAVMVLGILVGAFVYSRLG